MFDADLCERYVEMLINEDEVERALLVLDNVPARLRDHVPDNLKRTRSDILASMITTHAYMTSGLDSNVRPETALVNFRFNLRGRLVEEEVRRYNALGLSPHIVDVGPGEYWIPLALKELQAKFTYWDIAMDQRTQAVAHPLLESHRRHPDSFKRGPHVFLALEIIEHLPDPRDLVVECLRHCGSWPERIHLSTPLYCYDASVKEWRKPCGLPHLRAYTPKEFLEEARSLFPGYQWQLYADRVMSLRGLRDDVAQDAANPLVASDQRGKML